MVGQGQDDTTLHWHIVTLEFTDSVILNLMIDVLKDTS